MSAIGHWERKAVLQLMLCPKFVRGQSAAYCMTPIQQLHIKLPLTSASNAMQNYCTFRVLFHSVQCSSETNALVESLPARAHLQKLNVGVDA